MQLKLMSAFSQCYRETSLHPRNWQLPENASPVFLTTCVICIFVAYHFNSYTWIVLNKLSDCWNGILAGLKSSKLYIFKRSWTLFNCHNSFGLHVIQKELQLFQHTHLIPTLHWLSNYPAQVSLVDPHII